MIEELRKKTAKKALILTVILFIAGLVILAVFSKKILASMTGYESFEALKPEEIKNQMVELDLATNFGCFLEQYEENTSTKVQTTKYLYYIIWTGDDYATDYRYMSIRVPAKYENQMEAMADNTYNKILSDPIHFAGEIRKLSSEEYSYFSDFFKDAEWTDEDIAEGTLPYCIIADNETATKIPYILALIVSLALIVWGVLRLIKASKGGYLKKLRKDIENAGYTESVASSDYSVSLTDTAFKDVKIGRLFIYSLGTTTPRAVANKNLSWVYQKTTTHRTNGIKTGTTYNLVLNSEEATGTKSLEIPLKNEAACQSLMSKIGDLMPWVVVGYSDEIAKMFSKSHAEFLAARFNTTEHMIDENTYVTYQSQAGFLK